jgi:predicted amidophosphoribosyltransferase
VRCGDAGRALCPRCAGELRPPPGLLPPVGLIDCRALCRYDDAARTVLTSLKNGQRRDVLGCIADDLARLVGPVSAATVVTWAPTGTARQRHRGFDQAELLARAVARRCGLPARPLLRRAAGPAQAGRDRRARQTHPGFTTTGRVPLEVVLVDDVATTGATLAAAGRALRGAGATQVHGLVVARAVGAIGE